MPLVMMCGLPCAGKTTISNKLKEHLEANNRKSIIISDDTMRVERNAAYHSSEGNEKEVRGELRSDVQKHINRDTVVILDSLNYIKGFRYELFCIAKNFKTPSCVVYCQTPVETCRQWNEKCQHYDSCLIDELALRFEEPNARQRWDSPCFTINPDNTYDSTTVFNDLTQAIFNADVMWIGAPRPNQSTQSPALAAPDFLHQIDSEAQEVVDAISTQQSLGNYIIRIPGAETTLELTQNINVAKLRRLKRQYITYTKSHPPSHVDRVKDSFLQYLRNTIL